MVNITIKGLDEVNKLLRNVIESKPAIDRFANRVLFKIQREGAIESPVKTSTLKRSIHTKALGWARGYVATNTDYALYVHEGTTRQRANPFMERAVENTEGFTDQEIEKLLDSVLK
jgi:HK97 gp10 family phage protein